MPRRRRLDKRRHDELTLEQYMELSIGPRDEGAFASDDARRAAWVVHRDELLAGLEDEAVRPWAFWRYEPGVPAKLRNVEGRGSDELDRRRRAWLGVTVG